MRYQTAPRPESKQSISYGSDRELKAAALISNGFDYAEHRPLRILKCGESVDAFRVHWRDQDRAAHMLYLRDSRVYVVCAGRFAWKGLFAAAAEAVVATIGLGEFLDRF